MKRSSLLLNGNWLCAVCISHNTRRWPTAGKRYRMGCDLFSFLHQLGNIKILKRKNHSGGNGQAMRMNRRCSRFVYCIIVLIESVIAINTILILESFHLVRGLCAVSGRRQTQLAADTMTERAQFGSICQHRLCTLIVCWRTVHTLIYEVHPFQQCQRTIKAIGKR